VDADFSNLTSFQSQIPRILATGEKLPFPSSAFDIVTMIEVLEHTIDDRTVLAECNRILNVDGYLALFVPNKLYPMESHPCHIAKHSIGRNIPLVSWLPSSIRKHLCFAKIYSKRQLLAMARESGFLVEKLSYVYPPVDSFPLPQTFKNLYRTLAWRLEESPLQIFGVSIFALLRKTSLLNVKSTLKAHRTSEHSR
jgi:ubiquinone/menaquinone biosynthesis C-methylase UbiE